MVYNREGRGDPSKRALIRNYLRGVYVAPDYPRAFVWNKKKYNVFGSSSAAATRLKRLNIFIFFF